MTRRAHDFLPLTGAEHRIDVRELAEQRVARALREAAGDDQSAQLARLLEFGDARDRVFRFTHRALEERARVDHRDVGIGGIGDRAESVTHQKAEHVFGVHGVLRAPERDEGERGRRRRLRRPRGAR